MRKTFKKELNKAIYRKGNIDYWLKMWDRLGGLGELAKLAGYKQSKTK